MLRLLLYTMSPQIFVKSVETIVGDEVRLDIPDRIQAVPEFSRRSLSIVVNHYIKERECRFGKTLA